MKRFSLALIAALFACWSTGQAQVLTKPRAFPTDEISPPLVVQDADVINAVATLMQRYDIPIRLTSDRIEGSVSGRIADVNVPILLNRLGALYGFYWYYDGSFIEIGLSEEVIGETIKIAPSKVIEFRASLNRLGMEFSQFPMSINNLSGVIFVRGPESLLSMIRDLADQYQDEPSAPPDPVDSQQVLSVNVIHGRQLAVGDSSVIETRTFSVGGAPALTQEKE